MRHVWLICYDIASNKRRYRVDRLLANYGERIQYSVYQTILSKSTLNKVRKDLRLIIDEHEDRINYYHICVWCKDKVILQGTAKDSSFIGFSCIS